MEMRDNPEKMPYGKIQDFRLPLNCKKAGAPNYLRPVEKLAAEAEGLPALTFASWPPGVAEQVLFGMVAEVPPGCQTLRPLRPVEGQAPRRRGDDRPRAPGDAVPEQAPQHFTEAVLEVLGAWEEATFGHRTDAKVHHWISDTEVYMLNGACGYHRCPHGHTYHSNNFQLRVDGGQVCYGCCFTMENASGECSGRVWNPIGRLPAGVWRVPRESYDHTVRGIPRVKPFPREPGSVYVECSEMGLGKTCPAGIGL